jgi:hypothetical protein
MNLNRTVTLSRHELVCAILDAIKHFNDGMIKYESSVRRSCDHAVNTILTEKRMKLEREVKCQ